MATAVYANREPQSLQAFKHCLWKSWKSNFSVKCYLFDASQTESSH